MDLFIHIGHYRYAKTWKIFRLLSQAAACDGLVYSVDYNGQNSGTQASALPLFEDWYNRTIV